MPLSHSALLASLLALQRLYLESEHDIHRPAFAGRWLLQTIRDPALAGGGPAAGWLRACQQRILHARHGADLPAPCL